MTAVDRPAVEVHTSMHVAKLHAELGVVVRAASFAISKLGSNPVKTDVRQAESVLRQALEEISR